MSVPPHLCNEFVFVNAKFLVFCSGGSCPDPPAISVGCGLSIPVLLQIHFTWSASFLNKAGMSKPITQETSQDTNTSQVGKHFFFMKFRIESYWPYFCFHRHISPLRFSRISNEERAHWGWLPRLQKIRWSHDLLYFCINNLSLYNSLVMCNIISNTTIQRRKWSKNLNFSHGFLFCLCYCCFVLFCFSA